jgi:ketosteroid isomerase-like protein
MLDRPTNIPTNRESHVMKRILTCLAALLISLPAMADPSDTAEAAVRDAVKAFNAAYAENRVDDYFGYYADDASLYFYGARQTVAGYHEEWGTMIADGGGVDRNELSDLQVRVLPGGQAAVASYFIDYRMHGPDGAVTSAKAFETDVWQKIDGAWKLVSLHYSENPSSD